MKPYSNAGYSIGDPVEVSDFRIKNMRGDYRISWRPATVSNVSPELVVAFNDGVRLVIEHSTQIRTPRWFLERHRKAG